MDQLWAPWRLAYVVSEKPPVQDDACFICQALARQDDRANLLLVRGGSAAVFLNRFPYNNGHLLIVPTSHKARLDELNREEVLDTQNLLRTMIQVLDGTLRPDGYNVGLNLGKVAGAGVPGHLHWHIVPRWSGDTNFMPVLSDTRVIVQALDALYDLLSKQLALLPDLVGLTGPAGPKQP
jgi:ATP adenylyltransferase